MRSHTPSRIAEVMRGLPPHVGARTPVSAALALAWRAGASVLLVGAARRVRGAIALSELERARRFGLERWPVGDLLVGEVRRIAVGSSIASARRELARSIGPLLLVVDGRGRPCGWIAREDLGGAGAGATGLRTASPIASRLRRLPPDALELLRAVGERAPGGAWLVGGVVRDVLLGRRTRDLDVVVRDSLSSVIEDLAGRRVVHERFGTATIDCGALHVDFVEARRETYRVPGALPEVERAPLDADLFRRDFTANALAVDLAPGRFGTLVDLHGGLADLRAGQLRVFHGLSFVDDPTRAFRAVRFAARLGWEIEPRTRRLLRRAVRTGFVEQLSPARLLREVRLGLEETSAPEVVDGLARHGLLRSIGIVTVRDRAALRRLPTVLDWLTRLVGEPVSRWVATLGLLLPPDPDRVLDRLRPARADRALATEIARSARALARALAKSERRSKVWRACHGLSAATWAAAVALNDSARTRRAVERYVTELRHLRLAIDGGDIRAAGVSPGPAIAEALDRAREALLDGRAPDAASQLRVALRRRARG